MNRGQRIAAATLWDRAFDLELAGARRRALTTVMRRQDRPTLRDLLVMIGDGLCDVVDTPTAGSIRLGDLVRRDGEGPMLAHVLESLGLGLADPLGDALRLGLDLEQPLAALID